MNVNKIIIFIILIAMSGFLSGCSEKQLQVITTQDERIKLNLSEPSQINLKPITFYVLTENNKDVIFAELQAQNKDKVIIGISDEDYQKMSENLLLIQDYIVQQRYIIKSYKEYYETEKGDN
jgi:hypothetical protein